ncbi:MAG: cupredoxin domain-containing protein [Pseudomonadota bacterium]
MAIALLTLVAGFAMSLSSHPQAAMNPPVVKITASRFHFSPDRITVKKGQPVTLELISTDITHGFMVRPLKIDTDIHPDKPTELTLVPAAAGTFKVICDHYCGLGHGMMKMTIVVE